ncbi:MAG: hypothetical protein HY820_04210 [Acidobacteria bacterium]|nr:hypothetical protein [Acidobacteriota bacterium]
MKVFQDLTVRGGRTALEAFLIAMEERLDGGWRRDLVREAETRSSMLRMRCYRCDAGANRGAISLWLSTHSDGHLYVSNILAEDRQPLSYDQYNAILQDFYARFALPAATSSGAVVELGKPDYQIDDFLSPAAASALREFSALANRSLLHPFDRRRWNEFLILAHREETNISSDMLMRWLVEEEHWPDYRASNIVTEFENARGLLEAYESQHA